MEKVKESERRLLEAASKAMDKAYVLWGFKVGAAVLAEDGKIYEGCNIESWISGLGTCAERCAINHAILHGNRKIDKIAIVMDKENKSDLVPCGVCLQTIHDFSKSSKIKIVMAKTENDKILFETVKVKTLEELLPHPFRK
ncbi:MAG: cytidine deaminase [Candidatus Bathycorpusculaceae bacterium]